MVRLWEIDPERVFALRHPSLLPWVLAMNSTTAQMREAIRRIERDPRAIELLQRAAAIAPLRLEPSQFNDIIKQGHTAVTYSELIQGTWLENDLRMKMRDEGRDEGRQEGRAEGREQGRLEAARQSIRIVAAKRIVDAGTLPGLDQVLSLAELQECLERLVIAASRDEAERAIAAYRAL